jgi:hypothetical protein
MIRRAAPAGLVLALVFCAGSPAPVAAARSGLPAQLSDREFWGLVDGFSERGGLFPSENLVSNELTYSWVVPELTGHRVSGGAYLGVGPEQNFTYAAVIRPSMAFIIDVRRGNLLLHLMYKAVFELSADRADFVGRLFTRVRPAGLGSRSTARDLMRAYAEAPAGDEAAYQTNLKAITDHLRATHGFALSPDDLRDIAHIVEMFHWYGPDLTYASTESPGSRGVTYADLMVQTDDRGRELSYLATEARYTRVRDLERRNLIVPVVGNFAGPKAIRAVGDYLRAHDATVTAFYVSNVETYLRHQGLWANFCANAAALPLAPASVFIRPWGSGTGTILLRRFPSSPREGTPRVQVQSPVGPPAEALANILTEVASCRGPAAERP